jgi:hypothetical protein
MSLPPNSFTIKYANTADDLVAWNKLYLDKNINNSNLKLVLTSLAPAIFLVVYVLYFSPLSTKAFSATIFGTILLVSVAVITPILSYFLLRLRVNQKSKDLAKHIPDFLEESEITFETDNLKIKNSESNGKVKYSIFTGFFETDNHLFLRLSKNQALILPKKYFTTEQVEFIKSKVTVGSSKV